MPGTNRKMPKKMRGGGMAAKPKAMPVPPGMRKGGMAKKDKPPGMRGGGMAMKDKPPGMKNGGDAMKAKKKAKPKKKVSSGSRVRSSSSKPL